MAKSADLLTRELSVLLSSAVAVVIIRTREPHRAINSIADLAVVKKTKALLWTMTDGICVSETKKLIHGQVPIRSWETVRPIPAAAGTAVKTAIQQFTDGHISEDLLGNNYLIMQWANFELDRYPNGVQKLSDMSRELTRTNKRIILVAGSTWTPPEGIDHLPIIDFKLPNDEEQTSLLDKTLTHSVKPEQQPHYDEDELMMIGRNATGLTHSQAEDAFSVVITRNLKRLATDLPASEFAQQVGEFKISITNNSPVLTTVPRIELDEVGGLEVIKQDIQVISACITPEAENEGIDKPKGFLLVGPAGTGKTLAGQAIATGLNLPAVLFSASRVMGSLVGSSQKNMKAALDILKAIAPVVCIIDEAEKAFSTESLGNDGGASAAVLGEMLTFMSMPREQLIFFVLTANEGYLLPSAMIRKGRMDTIYYMGMPNASARDTILRIHIEKAPRYMEIPDDLSIAVKASSGYTGSEIEAAVIATMRTQFTQEGNTQITGQQIAYHIKLSPPDSAGGGDQFKRQVEWASQFAKNASLPDVVDAPVVSRSLRLEG